MPPAKPPLFTEAEIEKLREVLAILGDGRIESLREIIEGHRRWKWVRSLLMSAVIGATAVIALYGLFKTELLTLIGRPPQ